MSGNSFINELIKKQGDEQIEFLPDFDIPNILKSVCAFLNSEGGWILIGYNGKKLIGISEVNALEINSLRENISDRIFPQPLVYTQLEHHDDKVVALVNVLKGARQPYSLDKKYYVRGSNNNIKEASPDDISLLLRSSNKFTSTWKS